MKALVCVLAALPPHRAETYGFRQTNHPSSFCNEAPTDVRNNVIYDYGEIASGLTQGVLKVNYVGNYIRPPRWATAEGR